MGPMFNPITWFLALFYLPIVLLVVVPIASIFGLAYVLKKWGAIWKLDTD